MLTMTQRKTYEFIKDFIYRNQYSPTTAEIAKGIGITSRGVVHRYIKALVDADLISLTPKRHRNISLINHPQAAADELYLVGRIAAGQPIEAVNQQEPLDVANIFTGKNRYALEVKGDSMIDEGIFDGDIVICQQADSADNGQIVVALIDQNEATLKRLQRNKNQTVTLVPANSTLDPITYEADRVTVQGVYVGLLRLS